MMVLLPRESRQVEDHDEMDTALVRPAVLEQSLQFWSISGLGALALVPESLQGGVAFAPQYSSQARSCVAGSDSQSLLRADADVQEGADHRCQLRSVITIEQLERAAHRVKARRVSVRGTCR